MTLILGIDPDTKNTGLAVVEWPLGKLHIPVVRWVGVASAKGRLVQDRLAIMSRAIWTQVARLDRLQPEIAVIEWQALRPRGEKNPNSIVDLCGVAGMCVMASGFWASSVLTPTPSQWKGSVPKPIHQKRIMSMVTFDDDCGYDQLTKTQRGHVTDAIGLALWGYDNKRGKDERP